MQPLYPPGANHSRARRRLAYLRDMPPLPDIGISTSAWSTHSLPFALERIAKLAPAAEIRSFDMHTLLSKRNRVAALAAGLSYTVHGPFGYRGLGDASETARRAALDEHARHLEAAAAVSARLYIVHPDWHPEVTPRDSVVVAALERSYAELYDMQDGLGLEVVVENMPGAGHSHFTQPGDLDLQGLGLILDVGHASISGCLDDWLTDPRATLRHLHVHDNAGVGDDDDPHLPLGAGVVDAAAVIRAARAAGASVVLEHYDEWAVLASLARLQTLDLL